MSTLLRNATCITLDPPAVRLADIRIQDGTISAVGRSLGRRSTEKTIDLDGRIVMPGLVNAHTHLYSALARGMAGPPKPPANFPEILSRVWWKLDRALDEDSIYYSALMGGIEAVLCGTTALIDHHASPNAIRGSLDIIREALATISLRSLLSYEVTDRGGLKRRDEGLRENERYITANKKNPFSRGMVGAHASFTLGEESLRLCGQLSRDLSTGTHIHLAEDLCDVTDAKENYLCTITERLERHNIIRHDSIFAHCVHLDDETVRPLHRNRAWMIHNPRSNMNNRVGYAPLHLFHTRSAIGTDGFPADMFFESSLGFLKQQDGGLTDEPSPSLLSMVTGGHRILTQYFGKPFGTISRGAPADLIVLDYHPPTPLTSANAGGHFLFGLRSGMVESVMIGGTWVLYRREFPGLDLADLHRRASKAAAGMWKTMDRIRG